ncbi:hypothetical protein [Stieleria mannarensis]|uniref:hypothetical protein n=1 Tax=Stieleria mannarensis TaxID=2755585 RepID=UPI001601A24B|nr:hypothetical protein [Rhodopirellula sp. JC639]
MSRFFSTAILLTCGVLICVLATGCGDAPDPVSQDTTMTSSQPAQATETSLVLAEMPEGEISTPTEVMESGQQAVSVILGGRIDAGDADPFQPGQLSFMISQLPDEGHGEGDPDHADNCPFCKRKLENAPRAIVQFKGSDGNVLEGDSRQRLALEKGDIVYVTGMAQYNPAVNTVMVNATGVFRKSDP